MFCSANDPRFWDRIARKYATDTIADLAGYEKSLERTLSHLRMSDRVYEFGCGTGSTALRLAPHVGQIVATDISATMIRIAQEKADAGWCGNIEFRCAGVPADWSSMGSFDAVLGFNVLHLVQDRPALLNSIYAVLKPGGLFISKTPCLKDMNPIIAFALPVMQLVGKAPFVARFSAAQIEAEMVAAGFVILETGRHATKGRDTRPYFVAQRPSEGRGHALPPRGPFPQDSVG